MVFAPKLVILEKSLSWVVAKISFDKVQLWWSLWIICTWIARPGWNGFFSLAYNTYSGQDRKSIHVCASTPTKLTHPLRFCQSKIFHNFNKLFFWFRQTRVVLQFLANSGDSQTCNKIMRIWNALHDRFACSLRSFAYLIDVDGPVLR